MKKETVQEIIEKNNQIFQNADAAGKRMLIARDVIFRVENKQYNPETGSWVNNANFYEEDHESLQEFIVGGASSCECCALGGLMLSCVVFQNKVTVGDYFHGCLEYGSIAKKEIKDKTGITKLFTHNQRKLIEIAFEEGGGLYDNIKTKDQKKAVEFGKKYISPKARLVAIMENIIENNGTFIP